MPAWLLKSSLPDEDSGQAMIRQSESRIQNALKGPFSERLVLKGTTHESFCDRLLYCRFPQFARAGNRSPGKLHGLLCDRIATFFSRALDHSH